MQTVRKLHELGIDTWSWVHDSPDEWEVRPLKFASRMNPETLSEETDPEFQFSYIDITSVSSNGAVGTSDPIRFGAAPSRARRIVRGGDTILATVRTYLKAIAFIDDELEHSIASTGFAVLRPRPGVVPRYLWRFLQAEPFVNAVVAKSTGVSYPAINPSELGALPVLLPSESQQHAIADFLDHETAKIDDLIEQKQRLIELLQEKRTTLITQAVTKGLDPSVEMKDSGVEWLGEIPTHWNLIKLRRLITPVVRPVRLDPNKSYREIGIRSWGKGIFHKEAVLGHHLGEKRVFSLRPGDFTLNIVFAWEGAVAVVSEQEEGMIASHRFPTFVPDPETLDLDYLLMFFQTDHGRALLELNSPGAAGRNRTLRVGTWLNEEAPVPDLPEQRRIVETVREEEERMKELIRNLKSAITLLHEYRTALISAAVTGKINVRKEVA